MSTAPDTKFPVDQALGRLFDFPAMEDEVLAR
jgi:hypothetical protein